MDKVCSIIMITACLLVLSSVLIFQQIHNKNAVHRNLITTVDRIVAHGYTAEEHKVQTTDGYILTLMRIPHSRSYSPEKTINRKRPIILLLHGMYCSSDTWIISSPSVTLAYRLADLDYDVWLGNHRGNRYARQHINISADSAEFWKFSFHEIGYYDQPSMIDYILLQTQQQSLHLIADSQGTTSLLIMLSLRREYHRKLRTSHLLSPLVFHQHSRSLMSKLPKWLSSESSFSWLVRDREYMPYDSFWPWLCKLACPVNSPLYPICQSTLSAAAGGWDFNQSLISTFCETHPAGASSNGLIHHLQLYQAGKFQQFDYGAQLNAKYYNRSTPPEYDLTSVKACLHLYYGDSDYLAESADVEYLADMLKCAHLHKVNKTDWNHYDFLWGDQLMALVNDIILTVINTYENKY